MSIATLSCFPESFVAGDTINTVVASIDYPANAWTMIALLTSRDGVSKSFKATADVDGTSFDLLMAPTVIPGVYILSYVFANSVTGERYTFQQGNVTVLPDPQKPLAQSTARITLDAMEAALQGISSGKHSSVTFNGQSFTRQNLAVLQKAIDQQRVRVNAEEVALGFPNRYGAKRIGVRFL